MKTFKTSSFSSIAPTVTVLGCFDGVHLGHKALITHAIKLAREKDIKAAVWSFDAPPKNYFSADKTKLLTTQSEKAALCRRLGVDILVCAPFDEQIASMSAEDFFFKILIKKMKSIHIVCGYNYRFGQGGKGDVAILSALCTEHGIGLSVIPEVKVDGITVSSTAVRNALIGGEIETVNAMLGRVYSLRAVVCDGQHLGRQLGFPTINQVFSEEKLLPKNGVYASRIRIGNRKKYGITNIGMRPTVNGQILCAETHIFDLCEDLYGRMVTVELLQFLRAEQKFGSLEALTAQVNDDISKAKEIFKIK